MRVPNLFKAIILLVIINSSAGEANAQKLHKVKVNNLKQLQSYFTYDKKKDIVISGHRGGMMSNYPENSIEACEKTLTMMPSFFEIDPQLTKDSVIVLMHDKTINRTTNGKGLVSDYTYNELQQFFLKDKDGKVTTYKIPTLMEMLVWGKDKTIFNFDNKGVPWEIYSTMLNENKFSNITLSVRSVKEALFYYERNDQVMLFAGIKNMDDYLAYEKSGIPWNRIIAYVGQTMDPKHQKVYDLLHAQGVMCMIAVAPTQDKLNTLDEKHAGYRHEISLKPDIIETDYPSLFRKLDLRK
jgi:glycerophosphoryl diester phosphodiesterase